ncbi:hypothetical protein JCM33374_g4056 [Metschnikowia sp. JCM 33374]|nr:hypothetical protein JCM33374_g4056 [Metschnikowia sp. JCM 33374]
MSPLESSTAAILNATRVLPHEFYVVQSLSQTSGILSLSVWLFAQLPQILENYLNQSVSGVSGAFLACWISGDVTNLVGCILTRALPFQTCLAAYYCFIDLILTIQYWYYTRVYPRQSVHHNMLQSPNMMKPVMSNGSAKGTFQTRVNRFEASPKHHSLAAQRSSSSSSQRRTRRPRRSFLQSVLSGSVISSTFGKASAQPINVHQPININTDQPGDPTPHPGFDRFRAIIGSFIQIFFARLAKLRYSPELIGTCSGWISTGFYLSSRAPQIMKNFRSKSTTGVSPFLFLFAMSGNILYTISIASDLYLLSRYDQYLGDAQFSTVLAAQLPFLIGSSGTVIFDAVLLFQFWLYQKKTPGFVSETTLLLADPNGHSSDNIFSDSARYPGRRPITKVPISLPNETQTTNDLHFTKPDWYTNNFAHQPVDNSFSYDDSQKQLSRHTNPDRPFRVALPVDQPHITRDPYIISPPSHYVVSSAQSSVFPASAKHKRGLSETFSAFAKSMSTSPMIRSPSAVPNGGGTNGSFTTTALLPSLVGTYSSISKKMANDSKIPFSPIDFLHDDFLHRSGSSTNEPRHSSSQPRF